MAEASKIITKAAVAVAIVGGGAALGASQAGAQEAPPAPPVNPLDEWRSRFVAEYGPKVIEFVEGLRPADDPTTAEITYGPTGATATGIDRSPWVFGQTEATPNGARVTVLRHGDKDLLTKEGDADGGTWGGEWAGLGRAIDWVNERTCPSGGHGGEDLCITFFEAKATIDTTEAGEPVSVQRTTHSIIDAQPISSTLKSAAKALIPNETITLSGTASGNSAQHDASFSLFKASKGADSISLLPSSSSWTHVEIEDAKLQTPPLTFRFLNQNVTLPPLDVNVPGSEVCASEASAATIGGTGAFAGFADFFGSPKSGIWGDLGLSGGSADCAVPTSGN